MRIKLSNYYWTSFYAMLIIGGCVEVFLFCSAVNSYKEDLIWNIGFMMAFGLIFVGVALAPWKYLMILELNDNIMKSYLFGRLKCEIDTNKTVYYIIFRCKETNTKIKTYIAISNEAFCYEERKSTLWSRNTYIDCYDMTKQIIFPYDEKTKCLFPLEKWVNVH